MGFGPFFLTNNRAITHYLIGNIIIKTEESPHTVSLDRAHW